MTLEARMAALAAAWLLAGIAGAAAGEVTIENARAVADGGGRFTVHVTLRHADTGWDHYADRWEVLAPDGTVLATRTLLHPHVSEQPFTRSLSGVAVPDGVERVMIRAHDSVHGDGSEMFDVRIPE